jgi:endoglucanase
MGVSATNVARGAPHPPAIGGSGGAGPGATTTTVAPATTTSTSAPVTTTTAPSTPPALSISDVSIAAGGAGTSTSLTFTITLSRPVTTSVTVHYATADGTAIAGRDYDARTGSATFPTGSLTRHIVVTVHGSSSTTAKTFFANLKLPIGATLARSRGRATIS